MTAATHTPALATSHHADRLLSALRTDAVADHLLGEQPVPGAAQVALTLRALSDFPLCIRILPESARRYRSGDPVTGVSHYLARFADHLAHHDVRTPYEPGFWILGEPVTHRMLRLVLAVPTELEPRVRPTAQQVAATLLALADTRELVLPRRIVEVAGDGDLPWNGATGIGLLLRDLADRVARS